MEYKGFKIELTSNGYRVILNHCWAWFDSIKEVKKFVDNYVQERNEKEAK